MYRPCILTMILVGFFIQPKTAMAGLFDGCSTDSSTLRFSTSIAFMGYSYPLAPNGQSLSRGAFSQALISMDNTRWIVHLSFKRSSYIYEERFDSLQNIVCLKYGIGLGRIFHIARKIEVAPYVMVDYTDLYAYVDRTTQSGENHTYISLPSLGCFVDYSVFSIPIKIGQKPPMKRWDWGVRSGIELGDLDLRKVGMGQSPTINWNLALLIRLHF